MHRYPSRRSLVAAALLAVSAWILPSHLLAAESAAESADASIGESTFPLSRTTTLSRFIARSEGERAAGVEAARKRAGIFYDTGFNLRSRRQF